MANSRIVVACRHCGEQLYIGKGYFGSYEAYENLTEKFDEFFRKHETGMCSDDLDASDDAKNHFVILEEGDELSEITFGNVANLVEQAKQEVAREIFDLIDNYIYIVKTTVSFDSEFLITSITELKKKYIGE